MLGHALRAEKLLIQRLVQVILLDLRFFIVIVLLMLALHCHPHLLLVLLILILFVDHLLLMVMVTRNGRRMFLNRCKWILPLASGLDDAVSV